MRKKILFAPLWGIFALSLLSSCRTEDGAITQKQIEDKRFAVFVPKSGKSVNYADGFAFLMKRYDNVNGTNISGINNTTKANLNASVNPLFQNTGSYVEFKVRSYIMKEENGEKWMIFQRVENNQVIGLIMCTLKEKETFIAFDEIKSDSDYYKQLLPLFQEAFNRYNRRKGSLALNASIKPMAIGGGGETENPVEGCGDDVQQCGSIEEVVVPGKPNKPKDPPSKPVGASSCDSLSQCPPPTDEGGGGGGGGGYFPNLPPQKIDYEQLKDFPCAYALAQQLTNEKIGGDLARLLKETFGANERVNINFISSNSEFLGKTTSGGFRFIGDANNFNGNVYLNKETLSNATQNFLLATLYHEVVHGYLYYELNRLGESQFNIKYPEMESYDVKLGDGTTIKKFLFIGPDQNHNRMGPFISGIEQAVLNFDPSYPANRAEALAMGGLIAPNSLPPGYNSIDSHEAEGSTAAMGKKCSK
ncbi:hypothetical protein [Elizabethkingia bruuniana]|uniref:hypothetical protein n=1 Tax=Elizabethkingia bruuniana TaxID=1756149 RepID=UPI000B2C006D|nr:hypothetical protein [Elizabethkingia bruuniana]